jgi:hypothetical protein
MAQKQINLEEILIEHIGGRDWFKNKTIIKTEEAG